MRHSTKLRKHLWPSIIIAVILSLLPLTNDLPLLAQSPNLGDLPPSTDNSESTVSEHQPRVGSSPFTPPEHNDTTFVVDSGAGLDTNCSFRDEGPLIFELEIDRYIGDRDKLLANGLLGADANLKMPAYDVDFSGGAENVNPERDRIWFNGTIVEGEFLRGENNTWIMNDFNIPVEIINFPSDPGENGTLQPASNTIRIDIDTANSELVWCTAIDWATLTIEVARPLLMVHGTFSQPGIWNEYWVPLLTEKGLPVATIDVGKVDSFSRNAEKIDDRVSSLQTRWGIDQLNIISHSKGGTDSRHYVETHDTVANLVQLGTPNGGTPLADLGQKAAIKTIGVLPTAILDAALLIGGPALVQQTTYYMDFLYNPFHGFNAKTTYTSLAGAYKFGGLAGGVADLFLENVIFEGEHDFVVPLWSVHALPYANHLRLGTQGDDKESWHTNMHKSPRIYGMVSPQLLALTSPTTSQAAGQTAYVASPSIQEARNAISITETALIVDAISENDTQTHSLVLDQSTSASLLLNYGTGNLDLVLTSPSGQLINPTVAADDPNIEYLAIEADDGLKFEIYVINAPESGEWTLMVNATEVVNASGEAPYFLSGFLTGTSIEMSVSLSASTYEATDPIVIQATLVDAGTPITGAQVSVRALAPNNSITDFILVDDGSGDDAQANDGIYSGRFVNTADAGLYHFVATATDAVGSSFTREALISAPVSSGSADFTGTFNDYGVDADNDGLFEELIIEAEVDLSFTGQYRVLGVLNDSEGNLIAVCSLGEQLSATTQPILLRFDGQEIFEHGIDGPYTLSIVRMAEDSESAPLPLDEVLDAHTTANYSYLDFRGSAIAVPGTGSDRGIDTDSDTLFDQLEISLDVIVATAGFYEWSARLVDSSGAELGVFASSGTLDAGRNSLTFTFSGEVIGANGLNGPYSLNDLLILGGDDSAVVLHAYTTTNYQVSQFEMPPPRPDLVVQEIGTTGSNLQVIIVNQGTAAVPAEQGFWVDLYIDPRALPTQPNQIWNFLADEGMVWGIDGDILPMEPGEVITLTVGDALYWPDLSNISGSIDAGTPIYVQVDSANTDTTYGGVLETHEALNLLYNNVAGPKPAFFAQVQAELYFPLLGTHGQNATIDSANSQPSALPTRTHPETEN